MATETTAAISPAVHDAYDSHGTATGVTNAKLGMWIFLSSEFLLFGSFISAYLLYKGRSPSGPKPSQVYDIPFTSTTSFILLMSSLTMVLALAAIQRGDHRRFRIWIMATALFGLTFVGGQVYEFTNFFREHHLALHTNVFGSTFFVLTGLHGAHVTAGIIWLLSLFGLSSQGRLATRDSEKVEIAGLYWHFVDVIWIVIFTVIYLVPK
jgi:heme/copper-type cytochrome/quinol oxidase subunit 3